MIGGPAREIVFYDGACGLCHRTVRFLLVRDPGGDRFLYAPIGGATFGERITAARRSALPDSIVVLTEGGSLLVRSRAVLHLAGRLGGAWSLLAVVLRAVPSGFADLVYDMVAKLRGKFFARPTESCPVLPPGLRTRFLP